MYSGIRGLYNSIVRESVFIELRYGKSSTKRSAEVNGNHCKGNYICRKCCRETEWGKIILKAK